MIDHLKKLDDAILERVGKIKEKKLLQAEKASLVNRIEEIDEKIQDLEMSYMFQPIDESSESILSEYIRSRIKELSE